MSLSGAGGNPLGSLQRPELNQQQQTATDQVAKQGAMVMKDTLEIPFSQMGGNIWKYRSDADRPLIPMYLQVAMGKKDRTPQEWGKIFDQLKKELPENLRGLLDRPLSGLDRFSRGLKTSLERFAKTLDLLRGAPLTITPEEQARREKAVAARDLSFLEELVRSSKKILPLLTPSEQKRGIIFVMDQVQKLVPHVIAKRRAEGTSQAIFVEIERLRKDFLKAFGEKTPYLYLVFLNSIEELHHLSYPQANHTLLHTLLRLEPFVGRGEVSLVGPTFKRIAVALFPGEGTLFLKERRTLTTILIALAFSLLTFGVQKGDVADTLSLALFLSEKILLGVGSSLLSGLFLTPIEARGVGEDLLGSLIGLLMAHTDQEEGMLEVLQKPFTKLLKAIVKRHKGEEEPFLQRVLLALESGRGADLFAFAKEALDKLGLKEENWTKDLRALQVFYTFLQLEMEDTQKGGGEMVLLSQSA